MDCKIIESVVWSCTVLFAYLLFTAPRIVAALAFGCVAVLVALAERISRAPPGSYLRAITGELAGRRARRREQDDGP